MKPLMNSLVISAALTDASTKPPDLQTRSPTTIYVKVTSHINASGNQHRSTDLCEVRIKGKGTAARAFSFFIDGKQAIAIDFITKVHSGKGDKATQDAIDRLLEHRYRLDEALEGRDEHDL